MFVLELYMLVYFLCLATNACSLGLVTGGTLACLGKTFLHECMAYHFFHECVAYHCVKVILDLFSGN